MTEWAKIDNSECWLSVHGNKQDIKKIYFFYEERMGGIGKWNIGKSSWVKNNNTEIPVPANQGWKTKASISKEEYKTSKARTMWKE